MSALKKLKMVLSNVFLPTTTTYFVYFQRREKEKDLEAAVAI